ncbi:MAG TPA: SdrD B-like domain-containing protein [Dehalococcoidia bacterium]|nr:SdrD B-like domain-containing protein [Dehalococcoidia bacterium]
MKRTWRVGAIVALVLGAFAIGQPGALAQGGSLTIEVRCQPNPEQIRVSNRTGGPLMVQRIDSSFGLDAAGEPVDVRMMLPAVSTIGNDVTVVFENGPNASGNVLLTTEIFDDANLANERLILTTDRGTFEVPCASGTNSLTTEIRAGASPSPANPGVQPASTAGASTPATSPTPPSQPTPVGGANTATQVPIVTPATGTGTIPQTQVTATPTSQSPVPRPAGPSISGMVFNDQNENAVPDAGEAGIAGVAIALRSPGPDGTGGTADDIIFGNTSTGSDGRYTFPNITGGSYIVVETDPPGAVSTTSNTVPVTVSNAPAVVNFGDRLSVTAGAAPAQAGGLPPIVLLPFGSVLIGLGLLLGKRSGALR